MGIQQYFPDTSIFQISGIIAGNIYNIMVFIGMDLVI